MKISSSPRKGFSKSPSPKGSNRLTTVFEPWQGIDPTPITARVAGRVYRAPAMRADEWFAALQRSGWLKRWRFIPDREHDPDGLGAAGMFDLMCSGAADLYRLSVAVDERKVTAVQLATASRKVFERAAGVPWWVAERIAVQSVSWSGIGGLLYTSGLRPDVPLPVWLGAAYRTWMSNVDDDARGPADAALALPPPGYDTEVQPAATIDELFV